MSRSASLEAEVANAVARRGDLDRLRRDRVTVLLGHGVQLATAAPHAIRRRFGRQPGLFTAGDCTSLVDGRRTAPETAAFENGTLIHARAQDDTLAAVRTHVTACALPAVLAVCEAADSTLEEAVDALAVAYEVAWGIGGRLGDAVGSSGARATAVFGPVAAAGAAAAGLSLGSTAAGHALAIASSFAGGTSQMWSGTGQEWATTPGFAAATGVRSAVLAANGMTGTADWLTGSRGLLAVFAGGRRPDTADVASAVDLISSKPYPICEIHQNTVAALADLRNVEFPQGVAAEDVASIELHMHPQDAQTLGVIDNPGPFGGWTEAMLSAQYCAVVALLGGPTAFESLAVDESPAVVALVARTRVVATEGISPSCVHVWIRMGDGRVFETRGEDRFAWSSDEFAHHLRSVGPPEVAEFLDLLATPTATVRSLMACASRLRAARDPQGTHAEVSDAS